MSVPTNIKPTFIGLRFLHESNCHGAPTATVVDTTLIICCTICFSVLILVNLFANHGVFSNTVPAGALILILNIIIIILSVTVVVPPLHR